MTLGRQPHSLVFLYLLSACTTRDARPALIPPFVPLDFTITVNSAWREQNSADKGSLIVRGDGRSSVLEVISVEGQEKRIARRIDAVWLRNKRVHASVKSTLRFHKSGAYASMRLSAESADNHAQRVHRRIVDALADRVVPSVGVVTNVELTCGPQVLGSFSSPEAPMVFGTANHLYSWKPDLRCRGCLRIERRGEDTFDPLRDQADVPVGMGLRLRMPLALWTDGKKTFPESVAAPEAIRPLPPNDLASRLASVIDIWSTLRWFYPYMDDLQIDWASELPRALAAASQAHSPDEFLVTLGRMVAALRDDHASVYRRTYDDGVLPFALYWTNSKLYVVDAIDGYRTAIPRGSILESIDGVPADILIRREISTTSAATPGWRDAFFPVTLADGPSGVLLSVAATLPDGSVVTVRVPRVARSRYVLQKHAPRPANGSEVAASVYYLDLGSLDASALENLLPKLTSARAIICDTRQEATPASFQVLAHVIDHEIKSPFWDSPIASIDQKRYQRRQSSIVPLAPRLHGRLVFIANGRTASAPETILQYARSAGIGIVVGEPTGGTNGDIAVFSSLGDLRVRFTGLRALNQDGSPFHGRGITPDVVVHPTVEGIRAGRDELLEAAIVRAAAP